MKRVVGGQSASMGNRDQGWVSSDVETDTSAQANTYGTSDRPHAGYTGVR